MNATRRAELLRASWPRERLDEGVEALARASGLIADSADSEYAAIEREPVAIPAGDVEEFLRSAAPAVVSFATPEGERALLLLRGRRRSVVVVDPTQARRTLAHETVSELLTEPLAARRLPEIDAVLTAADVVGRRRARARATILREQLASSRIEGAYLLRLPMSVPGRLLLRDARFKPRLLGLLALHAFEFALWMGAWWLIGAGALAGRFERGYLLAFGLLILTLIPLAMQRTAWVGRLTLDAGTLLKRRLLCGALALDPEKLKQDGVGRFLSRVIESEAIETLAIGSGLLALLASVELLLALLLFATSGHGWLALALVVWIGVTLAGARHLRQRRATWTQVRLELTHDVVEKMVGHRTRLAQEPPARRHDEEDRALERYAATSARFDGAARLVSLLPRAWLLVGLCGLTSQFVEGGAGSTAPLAVSLGAILVAYRAFAEFTTGISDLLGAGIGWKLVAPLFAAAESSPQAAAESSSTTTAERSPTNQCEPAGAPADDAAPILSAHALQYRYRDRGAPVLDGVDLAIGRGERLLLEGPSGSGKSTLCSLLAGLREPGSGLLLLRGLDRATIGERSWRRRVAAAPQFHENHVFANTLAFNLLLGRAWPPEQDDLDLAEKVCEELGLKTLLARMPSRLQQMVGETGWQLSHGERSRLYIGRALLQGAELVLLDESFAALDPGTLRDVIKCVERRAPSLLVVAHP